MMTTLNQIRKHNPCARGWVTLLINLGKPKADNEPLSIATILESNGLDDALWSLRAVQGHDREIRLFAVWCARRVEHLLTGPRSRAALNIAEAFANGNATTEQLSAAYSAACSAAASAGSAAYSARSAAASAAYSAHSAAYNAAYNAACSAAGSAACSAACSTACSAQATRLLEICTTTKELL